MRRRRLLAAGIAAATAGIGGCLGGEGAGTPTGTPSEPGPRTPTRTRAEGLGTVEYTVTNGDDEAHRVEAVVETASGRVVQETFEPELPPGGSVSSGSAGMPPDEGPYTLTFRTDGATATYAWDVRECVRIDLAVTVTDGGGLAVERTLCRT